MKNKIIHALFFFLVAGTVSSQSIAAKTYMEQTQVSPKYGTSMSYIFSSEIELGGFYQKSALKAEPEYGRPQTQENEFYGAYFAYPLVNLNAFDLKLNVRTGVSNGENFVITPGLMFDFKPIRNLSIGGGVGTRAFRPTFMASVALRLNKGNSGFLAFK